MKHWGIQGKVLFLALAPAALIAVVLAMLFVNSRIADLEQSLRDRGLSIARQLAPASEYGVFSGNREILQRLVDAARQETDVNWVAVTDSKGVLLAQSGNPGPLPGLINAHAGLHLAKTETANSLTFSTPVKLSQIDIEDVAGAEFDRVQGAATQTRDIGRVYVEMSRDNTVRR